MRKSNQLGVARNTSLAVIAIIIVIAAAALAITYAPQPEPVTLTRTATTTQIQDLVHIKWIHPDIPSPFESVSTFAMNDLLPDLGVIPEEVYIGAPPLVTRAIVAGEADVGRNSLGQVLSAIDAGADISIIGIGRIRYPFMAISQPGLTLNDLEGTDVAVFRPKAFGEYYIRRLMSQAGADADTVNYLGIGGSEARVPVLLEGKISATYTDQMTYFQIKLENPDAPMQILAEPPTDITYQVFYARTEWVNQNPETVQKIVTALIEAQRWFLEDKARWIEWTSTTFPYTYSPELLDTLYNRWVELEQYDVNMGVERVKSMFEPTITFSLQQEQISRRYTWDEIYGTAEQIINKSLDEIGRK